MAYKGIALLFIVMYELPASAIFHQSDFKLFILFSQSFKIPVLHAVWGSQLTTKIMGWTMQLLRMNGTK